MPSSLASFLGMALYGLLLAPLALAFTRQRHLLAWVYGFIFLGTLAYHTGLLQVGQLAPVQDVKVPVAPDKLPCEQIIEKMTEAGLSVNVTDPSRPQIVGPGREQVPPYIADIIAKCALELRTNASGKQQ